MIVRLALDYDRAVLDITVSVKTSASPEQVLRAATDFSPARGTVWRNSRPKHLEIHDAGDTHAEVTEGLFLFGHLWERSRYDWSEPGVVRSVVIDSNVLESGSIWELRAVPSNGGSTVEMHLRREFLGSVKGRLGSAVNHLSGSRGWASYLRRALAAIEKRSGQTHT